MKRGEVWTVSGGSDYTGKPRPALIIQDDAFATTPSVTICPFTSDQTDAQLIRPAIMPGEHSGLSQPSRAIVDKVSTIPRQKVGVLIGRLNSDDIAQVDAALAHFMGSSS